MGAGRGEGLLTYDGEGPESIAAVGADFQAGGEGSHGREDVLDTTHMSNHTRCRLCSDHKTIT